MYSDGNSYNEILNRALSNPILENYDRREGSVIYNALAPMCLELANLYLAMDIMDMQSFLITATGDNLDKRVSDHGITRIQATQARRKGRFQRTEQSQDDEGNPTTEYIDMDIPVGSRFSVPSDSTLTYQYTGMEDGFYILECEQAGSKGNSYVGTILPLQYISDLAVAEIIDDVPYQPGRDEETDDELRARALTIINYDAFGGNIQDYINWVTAIDGVGTAKVYPAWKENGSVLLSVVDSDYEPISTEFQKQIKEQIDPEESTGQGVGTAPIGHYVTITTPEKSNISISCNVVLESGYEVGNVKDAIAEKIQEYFDSERRRFSQDVPSLAIYRARVIAAILEVEQVVNVTDLMLNSKDEDVTLPDETVYDDGLVSQIKQFLPYTSADLISITEA